MHCVLKILDQTAWALDVEKQLLLEQARISRKPPKTNANHAFVRKEISARRQSGMPSRKLFSSHLHELRKNLSVLLQTHLNERFWRFLILLFLASEINACNLLQVLDKICLLFNKCLHFLLQFICFCLQIIWYLLLGIKLHKQKQLIQINFASQKVDANLSALFKNHKFFQSRVFINKFHKFSCQQLPLFFI